MIDMEKAKDLWPPTCHGRWMREEYVPGLVSVIIPTYNRAHLIGETLESLDQQTYHDMEILVCDDGSIDATSQIVCKDFRKARYLSLTHGGAAAARNAGIRGSTGEFVKFLDSDDLLDHETMATQVRALEASGADLCCCPCRTLFTGKGYSRYTDRIPPPSQSKEPDEWLRLWLRGGGTGVHAFLFRRRLVERIGFWDEKLSLRQDTDYLYRAFLESAAPVSTLKGCAIYRRHSDEVISAQALKSSGIRSWVRVIDKVRATLVKQGRLDAFRADLSFAYFLIARRAYAVDRSLALRAHESSCEMVPRGVPQGGTGYRTFYRIFGFSAAQQMETLMACFRKRPLPFGANR